MDAVDHIIARENLAEIAATLTGPELFVVFLKTQGMNGAQIAEHMGVHPSTVSRRLSAARRRILQAMPELAPAVDGRSRQRAAKHRSRKGT